MLEAVAFSLTPSQISILRTEFNAIDTDRSGTISLEELQEYVARVNTDNSPANTRLLQLAQEDYKNDSWCKINYIEFLAAAMCKRIAIDDERLVLAFETLDVESKGYLDADAIRRAMGAGISDQEVRSYLLYTYIYVYLYVHPCLHVYVHAYPM
jgi:calcium-dependent protein kinase